jgi:hypothetical protein
MMAAKVPIENIVKRLRLWPDSFEQSVLARPPSLLYLCVNELGVQIARDKKRRTVIFCDFISIVSIVKIVKLAATVRNEVTKMKHAANDFNDYSAILVMILTLNTGFTV